MLAIKSSRPDPHPSRIAWIDYGRGISIILVVMMHSTLGVEAELGERSALRWIVDFAEPFRVPAFFLLSGLLLSRTIDRPWPGYLHSKVAHFAYFYLLWLAIQCVIKFGVSGPLAVMEQFLLGLVEPFGTLWFIYILPLFFVATKLARRWPKALLAGALALNLLAPQTGWGAIDEFAARFVFFVAGYLGVHYAQALAEAAAANARAAVAGLALAAALVLGFHLSDWSILKSSAMHLALAAAGIAGVIAVSSLLARAEALTLIRTCGQHSLVIYLAFFLPMSATREVIGRVYPEMDATLASIAVFMAAVLAPFVMERVTRGTPLRFLFHRPTRAPFTRAPRVVGAE